MPDLNGSEIVHDPEKKRHQKKRGLGHHEQKFAVRPIDNRSAQWRENNPWQSEAQTTEPQVKWRVGKLKNEPTLRRRLDQRSAVSKNQTNPKNDIVAVAKGAEGIFEKHRREKFRSGDMWKELSTARGCYIWLGAPLR